MGYTKKAVFWLRIFLCCHKYIYIYIFTGDAILLLAERSAECAVRVNEFHGIYQGMRWNVWHSIGFSSMISPYILFLTTPPIIDCLIGNGMVLVGSDKTTCEGSNKDGFSHPPWARPFGFDKYFKLTELTQPSWLGTQMPFFLVKFGYLDVDGPFWIALIQRSQPNKIIQWSLFLSLQLKTWLSFFPTNLT